jgi:hypothetical protein
MKIEDCENAYQEALKKFISEFPNVEGDFWEVLESLLGKEIIDDYKNVKEEITIENLFNEYMTYKLGYVQGKKEFDIDIRQLYFDMIETWEEQKKKNNLKDDKKIEDYKYIISSAVERYFNEKAPYINYNFEFYLHKLTSFLLIKPTDKDIYEIALAFSLLFFKYFNSSKKYKDFLDYQYKQYIDFKGDEIYNVSFYVLLDKSIYKIINYNTPFINTPSLNRLDFWLEEHKLEKENNADENQKPNKKSQTEIEIKPVFKAVDKIFDILKNHFPNEQHEELKNVLTSGNKPKEKLLFLGNGKTLLDFFKQLLQGQFLTIPVQRDLEKWISDGFEYLHRGKQTKFTTKYASKIISGNERASKGNRLINVDNNNNGELEIIQLKLKNREQN